MLARIVLAAAIVGVAAPALAQTATTGTAAPQPVATAPATPVSPIVSENSGGSSGCGWSSAMAPTS